MTVIGCLKDKLGDRKKITEIFLHFTIFIVLGMQLGVMPIGEMMTNGLMYNYIGTSNIVNLENIFQLNDPSTWFPYGMRLTESFGGTFFYRFIALAGLSGIHSLQMTLFIFYTIGYICMIKAMNIICKNKFASIILTLIYFWNPAMLAQQGVPPLYFGILFIPVLILDFLHFQGYIQSKLESKQCNFSFERKDLWYIFTNFLCFLVLAFSSWYLAVIMACATCLYYLVFLFFYIRKIAFYKLFFNYWEYMLIPWLIALSINLLMTPRAIASTSTAFNFMNGSSIDVMTMLLPSYSLQLIGSFFSIEKWIPQNSYIPGNGVQFYFGYTLIVLSLISIAWKKTKNKTNISALFTIIVLLVISLGPGLRVGCTLNKDMIAELGPYRLPLEENILQFPWGWLFEKFPLNIMRAVYRWYIGVIPVVIVLAARVLSVLFKGGKRGRLVAYIICVCMFIEFIPRVDYLINLKVDHYNKYEQVYNDCVEELNGIFEGDNVKLAFCSYDYNDNTYMVPLIMRDMANCVSYSGAGDKARGLAKPYTPQCVYDFMHDSTPESLAINITKMNAFQLADYAILPYYDLSNAIYSWPMRANIVNRTKKIAEQVAERLEDEYEIIRLDHYMIIKLENKVNEQYIDLLADKDSENSKFFPLDDGFGSKYAFDTEHLQHSQMIQDEFDGLYIYCVTKTQEAKAPQLCIDFKDENGILIDTNTFLLEQGKEYTLTELNVSVPNGTHTADYYFSSEDEGKVYLKKIQIVPYNEESIGKSDMEIALEKTLGHRIEHFENTKLVNDAIYFSENSNLIIKDSDVSVGEKMSLKMDIYFSNETDVEIINKWSDWEKQMTFALSWHQSDEQYYFNFSNDGVNVESVAWSLSEMPKNQWNTLELSFDHGMLSVTINNKEIISKKYDFANLYTSNLPLHLGNGLTGMLKNFEYETE